MSQSRVSRVSLVRLALLPMLIGLMHLPTSGHAQVVATWIGPATGNWSNPANWDIGVVPINNGSNTYNVIIPPGKTIEFDIGANSTISGLNLQDTGKINIAGGNSLNVSGFTLVAGIVTANGVGSNFTATSPLTIFQPSPELHASNGAHLQVNGTTYVNNINYNRSFMSAIGTGSQLNLQSITSFDYNGFDNGGTSVGTVEAGQGGTVNLSGVQTIDGAQDNESLRFWIHTGGSINLQNLTNITRTSAIIGGRTVFDLEVPSYSLANLVDSDGVEFKVRAGNSVDLPSLTAMRNSRLDLISGATFNAPLLSNISGTILRNSGGASLNTSALTAINDSELHVHSGGAVSVAAPGYVNNITYNRSFMSAIGIGSQLNVQSITSFDYNGFDNGGTSVGTVEAGQGGTINLSGVQTIDGARDNESLRFWIHTGGSINLQNLTNITRTNAIIGGRTVFDIDSGSYSLPNLTNANGASFDIAAFASINLPSLTTLRDGRLDVSALATIDAPLLTDVQGTYVRIAGAVVVNAPAFTSIDRTELHTYSGGTINVAAPSYVNNINYNSSFMSAIGTGSQLNVQSITSFDYNGFENGGTSVGTVEASQGGVVNLAGLRTIDGAPDNETLRFFSNGAGRINIGSAGQTTNLVGGRTSFEVNGTNSVIHFGSDVNMAENTSMKATLNGRFEAEGDLIIKTKTAANFDLADGSLRMMGSVPMGVEPQFLEVAGTDNGLPSGSLGSNFQIGLLQIGTNVIQSQVVLQDAWNNNTNVMDSEALYLQGFPSEVGLRLLNASSLILNGLNVYIANGNGGYFSARDLIAPGQGYAQFGGGFISLTGAVGQIVNGDMNAQGQKGFNGKGAGMADSVVSDMGQLFDQRVYKLTAGSSIEISQNVSTFDGAFTIDFDAFALDTSGVLSLYLDGGLLQSWSFSELLDPNAIHFSYLVNNSALWGLIDTPLALEWNATTGHRVLLDNWSMNLVAVPEPGSGIALLALTLVCIGTRRSRGQALVTM